MRLVPIFVAPHLSQQLLMGYRPASVLDQVIEQAVFGWPEFDMLAVDDDFAAIEVYAEAIIDAQDGPFGCARHLGAAEHGLDPAGKFTRAKRLGDVIIRAKFQPSDLIIFFAFC